MPNQTVLVTYELTLDAGELNAYALSEWLKLAEEHGGTFTMWEVASSADITLISIVPKSSDG